MQTDWAYTEFSQACLWDGRCRSSLIAACQKLAEQSQISLTRALGNRRKAISHILHHPKATASDLLKGHVQATALRCEAHNCILIASDTTSCNFTSHKSVQGLGPINDKKSQQGFLVHSALAMSESGVPLGLLYQHSWVRNADDMGKSELRHARCAEEKESRKWLDALRGIEAVLPEQQKALLIQDREADVFSFFAAPRRAGMDLLIRAVQPRRVEISTSQSPSEKENSSAPSPTLLQAVALVPIVAKKEVAVHARPDREARQAILTIRLLRVSIRAPKRADTPKVSSVAVFAVSACEENPPAGVKEPIKWILLTTLPQVDAKLASQLVGYYALRWRIERFHFVLKSGCGYEKLQVDTFFALEKALSLYSIIAWRLLFLTYLTRESCEASAGAILSGDEREVLERYCGKSISTAQEAMQAIAKIGGFVSVPSAPLPGVKSLWLGLRKLQDVVAGYLLARQSTPQS